MRPFNFIQHSFAGGEISPSLGARSDLAKYSSGASEIENMIVFPHGPISSRPSCASLSSPVYPNGFDSGAKIVPFIFSRDDSAIFVFTNNLVLVFDIFDTSFSQSSAMTTGIPISMVKDIRTAEIGDIIYCVHPQYPPFKIIREMPNYFRLEVVKFVNGPFMDENASDKKLAIVHNKLYDTLTANGTGFNFNSSYIDDILKISYNVPEENEIITVTKGNSSVYYALGVRTGWRIETTGKYKATITVERKFAYDTTYSVYKTFIVDSEKEGLLRANGLVDPENPVDVKITIDCAADSSESIKATIYIESGFLTDYYKISSVTNINNVIVVPLPGSPNELAPKKDIPATKFWAFGAFSQNNLYPSVVAFHQNRLCLAGTRAQPDTVWMSRSNSFEDFGVSQDVADDDAVTFSLASNDIPRIIGMASMTNLLVFTGGAEWRVIGGNEYAPVTPTKLLAARQSNYGSANIEPIIVGGRCLFIHSSRKRVLDIGYQLESDSFVGADLAMIADHLFSSQDKRAVSWAYQQNPCSIVWIALADGSFLSLTYRRDQDVIAWARHFIETVKVREFICLPQGELDLVLFLGESNGRLYLYKFRNIDIHADSESSYFDFSGLHFIPRFTSLDCEFPSNDGNTALASTRIVAEVCLRTYRSAGNNLTVFVNSESPSHILVGDYKNNQKIVDSRITISSGWANEARISVSGEPGKRLTLLGLINRFSVAEQINPRQTQRQDGQESDEAAAISPGADPQIQSDVIPNDAVREYVETILRAKYELYDQS